MKDFSNLIKAYALKNALEHSGSAQAGAVISALFSHGLKKQDAKKVMKDIQKEVQRINKLDEENQKVEFLLLADLITHRKEREGLPELKNTESGVSMRFSPSPSGPLHIGHAITGMLSSLYVKKYGGKFYIRIDDTNPENILPEAYKMIEKEAKWLYDNIEKILIASDRMEIYYDYTKKLLDNGSAYVCTCVPELFKSDIEEKKACPCRKLSVKENLERWNKMLSKTKDAYKEGEAVVRFKGNIKDSNPAYRDWPLARINLSTHPRKRNKYRVWPLMNLAVFADDIEMKISHIIRGKDHRDNAKRQEIMYKVLGKKAPEAYFIGRINFTDLELSTTKTKLKISQGIYSGWDDPKIPFIVSLKKRGYKRSAFEKLTIERGLSDVDKVISQKDFYDLLDRLNKD